MPNYKISKNIDLEKMAFGSSIGHDVASKLTVLIYMVIIFLVMKSNLQIFDTEKILP
jgi:hypothetical protein